MATHPRHTCGGLLPTAVRDQSQPRRVRERGSTLPNLRRSPRYQRSRHDAQIDSKTSLAGPFDSNSPITLVMKRAGDIPLMGDMASLSCIIPVAGLVDPCNDAATEIDVA